MADMKPTTIVNRDEFESFKQEVTSGMDKIQSMLAKIAEVDEGRARYSHHQESRDQDQIHESHNPDWEEMTLLGNPGFKARDGYVQMWIRTEMMGEPDGSNVARMLNRGWTPRTIDTIPKELQGSCTVNFDDKSIVGWRGTILCEMKKETHQKIMRQREQMANDQMRAVEMNMLRDHDQKQRGFGAVQFTERKRTVETGRPASELID